MKSASLYANIVKMTHTPDSTIHSEMITYMQAFKKSVYLRIFVSDSFSLISCEKISSKNSLPGEQFDERHDDELVKDIV